MRNHDNYNLEREIRLSEDEESEYKDLCSWSLQEFDEEGKQIGDDQVPREFSLFFTGRGLSYYHSIQTHHHKIKSPLVEVKEETRWGKSNYEERVGESESITAILHPEFHTSYSMLGTDRLVEKFFLSIYKLQDNDKKERCFLTGQISNDIIVINLWLFSNRFNRLVELIMDEQAERVDLHLELEPLKFSGLMSGFYESPYSGGGVLEEIKVLTKHQKIIFPENCKIVPPRLGDNVSFDLKIAHTLIQEEQKESHSDTISSLLTQIGRNKTALTKLRAPLWLIFVVLLLLLIQRVF